MFLKEIFDHLAYGELHTVFLGEIDSGTGELRSENQVKLLSHINAGLDAIYARFNLRTERLRVYPVDGRTRYALKPEFARARPGSRGIRYIEPIGGQFDHPLFKVESVVTAKGNQLSLNRLNDPLTVITPQVDVIEIPEDLATEYVTVTYKAGLRHLDEFDLDIDSDTVQVDLPYTYLEALGYFIASRVLNPIGMQQQEMVQGTNYTLKYEAACQLIESNGLQINEDLMYNRARAKGFV